MPRFFPPSKSLFLPFASKSPAGCWMFPSNRGGAGGAFSGEAFAEHTQAWAQFLERRKLAWEFRFLFCLL